MLLDGNIPCVIESELQDSKVMRHSLDHMQEYV